MRSASLAEVETHLHTKCATPSRSICIQCKSWITTRTPLSTARATRSPSLGTSHSKSRPAEENRALRIRSGVALLSYYCECSLTNPIFKAKIVNGNWQLDVFTLRCCREHCRPEAGGYAFPGQGSYERCLILEPPLSETKSPNNANGG